MKYIKIFSLLIIINSIIACGNTYRNTSRRYIKYRIKRGDTLYSLARKYKTSITSIMRINRIRNPRNIKTGKIIVIPNRHYYKRRKRQSRRYAYYRNGRKPKFVYPIRGRLLSRFGWRRMSRYSRRTTFHNGIDLKGKIGAPIYASASGTVIYSGWKRGYGRVVKIKHGNFITVYGHNSRNLVRRGQRVVQGQIIAKVGMTGRTTGSHVHFEIRYKNKPLNPLRFLRHSLSYYP